MGSEHHKICNRNEMLSVLEGGDQGQPRLEHCTKIPWLWGGGGGSEF